MQGGAVKGLIFCVCGPLSFGSGVWSSNFYDRQTLSAGLVTRASACVQMVMP